MTPFFFRKPRHRLGKRQHRLGKRRQRLHRHAVATLALILAMLMFFALCGCKSARATVEIPVLIHDTTQTVRELHDSTFIDRWHTQWISGDTIYIHDSIDRWHSIIRRDTAYWYREVPVLQKVEVEVEKQLTKWQKFKMKSFWWFAVGLIGYILFRTRKSWSGLLGKL